jgi:hypothetical protein
VYPANSVKGPELDPVVVRDKGTGFNDAGSMPMRLPSSYIVSSNGKKYLRINLAKPKNNIRGIATPGSVIVETDK